MKKSTVTSTAIAFGLMLTSSLTYAAGLNFGGHDNHQKKEEMSSNHDHGQGASGHNSTDIGKPGLEKDVTTVVNIRMNDNYYNPSKIEVKEGETVRFVISNEGEMVHEFNIGTVAMHSAHQAEMLKMMNSGVLEMDKINHDMMNHGGGHMMKHDDPNSLLLEPGQKGEIVWKFTKGTELEFACNVPGHYEDGMKGKIHAIGHMEH